MGALLLLLRCGAIISIRIEYRWGDGRADRLPEIEAEFVRLKVDAIVTTGTPVPVLKEVTSAIPIVFTIANDPVDGGLVGSLSRPGGNVTGLSQLAADLGGKRLEGNRCGRPRIMNDCRRGVRGCGPSPPAITKAARQRTAKRAGTLCVSPMFPKRSPHNG